MYDFKTNREEFHAELNELIRQFYHANIMRDFSVIHCIDNAEKLTNLVDVNGEKFFFEEPAICSHGKLLERRILLRSAKLSLYKALSTALKRSLPWGALTGVRPTKLAYELLDSGINAKSLSFELQKNYLISKEKSDLVSDIILSQNGHIKKDENLVNLYVHIPFCPSRCHYCSFVSTTIEKQKDLVEPYVEALVKEITKTLECINSLGKKVYSVYIGGGTPTSISDEQFNQVLSAVTQKGIEFTVEAGRPETLTTTKAEIMKRHGVTRISVNPQSLNKSVLVACGRVHSVEDFYNAYHIAMQHGFVVNTDLIAGLKEETLLSFLHGLETLISLKPHNITVHTLSQKRGSILKESNLTSKGNIMKNGEFFLAERMLDLSHEKLKNAGYIPYYLYRQKLMLANLENAGYSLPSYQCVNNITTMEETLSVFACGAGAISKRIFHEKYNDKHNVRIERYANLKDVKLYLEQFDERLAKKILFYQI